MTKTPRISREEFYATIEAGLAMCPALRTLAPAGYPRTGSARVDVEKALDYESERTDRFLHNFNLPLALHLAAAPFTRPSVRAIACRLLFDLEDFSERFGKVNSARGVLEPLWKALFDRNDPNLWSALVVCIVANLAVERAPRLRVRGADWLGRRIGRYPLGSAERP